MYHLLIALMAVLLGFLVYKWIHYWKDLPPGPWGLPLLGSLLSISPTEPYRSLSQMSETYGPIFSIRLGRLLAVVLTDPKVIREALSKEELSGRADLYLTHGIMNGYGLICAEGKRWREQRSFVISTLKNMGMVKIGPKREVLQTRIMEGVTETVDCLREVGGREVDACQTLLHTVGNVINDLVFGHRWSRDDETWLWLQHLADEGVKHIGVAGPLNFLPFLRFLPKYKKTMHFLVDGLEKTHKVYRELIDTHPDGSDENFIAAFLREQQARGAEPGSFTGTQFHYMLADLFGAGVDTTLTTLRWFLICVAHHPPVQRKIQEELDSVCQGVPTLAHAPHLPYLQATVAESQRIRPVVPTGIPHGALKDIRLSGYRVPRGSMVMPLLWAVHMSPQYWNRPEIFDPDRFLDAEGKFTKPEAFMPFQTGKRSCLGEELARMIVFLFTANLLHHFTVELPPSCDDPLRSECGITLVPTLRTLIFHPRRLKESKASTGEKA